jgi:chromosomal replication initiation ATPase DnaA
MISPYVVPGLRTKIKDLKRIVSITSISDVVCFYYATDIEQLRIKNRNKTKVQARYIMCYMLRKHTEMSLDEIAQYLSPAITHHCTIMHGIAFVQGQLSLKHDNIIKIVLNEIYI